MIDKKFFLKKYYLVFLLCVFIKQNILLSESLLPFPNTLLYNEKSNSGFIFESNLIAQKNNLYIYFNGKESFRLIYREKIPLKTILFEVILETISLNGTYNISLILEFDREKILLNRKNIRILENKITFFFDSLTFSQKLYYENKTFPHQLYLLGFMIIPNNNKTFLTFKNISLKIIKTDTIPSIEKFL